MWYILQNVHFMRLMDMKYISKIFEILLDESSSFFAARLFEKCHNLPLIRTKKWVSVFSIMHVIHFGFLAASVGLRLTHSPC